MEDSPELPFYFFLEVVITAKRWAVLSNSYLISIQFRSCACAPCLWSSSLYFLSFLFVFLSSSTLLSSRFHFLYFLQPRFPWVFSACLWIQLCYPFYFSNLELQPQGWVILVPSILICCVVFPPGTHCYNFPDTLMMLKLSAITSISPLHKKSDSLFVTSI